MNFKELQVWISNYNILPTLATSNNVAGVELGETTEFFFNATNLTTTSFQDNIASDIGNNSLAGGYDTHSQNNSEPTSLYIPLTSTINTFDIQALVLYNRIDTVLGRNRAIGTSIELYNRANDTTLSNPLVFTNTISIAEDVYR